MSEIEAAGPKGALSFMRLDVTDELSIEDAAAHVGEKFGRLDVLVNNAGVGAWTIMSRPVSNSAWRPT